ncbi:MAG: hypothetical protein KDD69_17095, partial [Bdellovibrionales bacterium]|nr:hypothetical protein [Bdellovibrionales bacterium]
RLHLTIWDFLPTTTTFVGIVDENVVASLTTVATRTTDLPSFSQYAEEITAAARTATTVAEGVKFACVASTPDAPSSVPRELVRQQFYWWESAGIDEVFVVVHPHHTGFWKRFAAFETASAVKPCQRVGGSPGVLLKRSFPLPAAPEEKSRVPKPPPGFSYAPQAYRLNSVDAMLLLLSNHQLALDGKHRKLLERQFPELAYALDRISLVEEPGTRLFRWLSLQPTSVAAVVANVLAVLAPAAAALDVRLSSSSQEAATEVVGDPVRLASFLFRFLRDFITNAPQTGAKQVEVQLSRIRQAMSPLGEALRIRVAVQYQRQEHDLRQVALAAERSLADFASTVPEPTAGYPSSERDSQRLRLVELLGGTAQPGPSSRESETFFLSLPAIPIEARPMARPGPVRRPPRPAISLLEKRALVIVSDPVESVLFSQLLRSLRVTTEIVGDNAAAVRLLGQEHFALLLIATRGVGIGLHNEGRFDEALRTSSYQGRIIGITSTPCPPNEMPPWYDRLFYRPICLEEFRRFLRGLLALGTTKRPGHQTPRLAPPKAPRGSVLYPPNDGHCGFSRSVY